MPRGGAGLGNKFLSHIRQTDALVHVIRCYRDDDVIHVDGSVDPVRDIDTVNVELALADLAQVLLCGAFLTLSPTLEALLLVVLLLLLLLRHVGVLYR